MSPPELVKVVSQLRAHCSPGSYVVPDGLGEQLTQGLGPVGAPSYLAAEAAGHLDSFLHELLVAPLRAIAGNRVCWSPSFDGAHTNDAFAVAGGALGVGQLVEVQLMPLRAWGKRVVPPAWLRQLPVR